MKTNFKNFESRPLNGGIQYLVFFPNGFGASIVQHSFSYGKDSNLWELAVISGNKQNYDLRYDTRITNDVIGYLSEDDVNKLLNRIKRLKKRD